MLHHFPVLYVALKKKGKNTIYCHGQDDCLIEVNYNKTRQLGNANVG